MSKSGLPSVNKHVLRKQAEKKRDKHAQRTPLPPRAGEVQAAKEAVAEVTLPSVLKATDFAKAATAAGWEAVTWWEGDHSKVLATRGPESIQIEWVKGVFVPETCNHRHGEGNATKLRNASAAKAKMAVAAAEAETQAVRKAESSSRGPVGARVPKQRGASHPRSVQFGAVLDADVVEAVRGRKITWTNRITGEEETDFVRDVVSVRIRGGQEPSAKIPVASLAAPRITEDVSGRTLRFLGAFGFRCVLVDSISRVGR